MVTEFKLPCLNWKAIADPWTWLNFLLLLLDGEKYLEQTGRYIYEITFAKHL